MHPGASFRAGIERYDQSHFSRPFCNYSADWGLYMNDHEYFNNCIAEYLACGLDDDEWARFDAHRAACPDCAREFEAIEQTEKMMTELFAAVAPGTNFEEQLLGRRPRSCSSKFVPGATAAKSSVIIFSVCSIASNSRAQSGQAARCASKRARSSSSNPHERYSAMQLLKYS